MSIIAAPAPIKARRAAHKGVARWFYPIAGVVLLVFTLWGFERFYFHARAYPDREITPPIRLLVITHGVAMALWIVLFTLQPWLIALKRHRSHMMFGRIGAALAACVFVLGLFMAVYAMRAMPPGAMIWNMPPRQFLSVPLLSILFFGVCVGLAVWKRKKPALHRALMLTATIAAVDAAIARIDRISNLFIGTAWEHHFGPFFGMLLVAAGLLALRCAMLRSFDRVLGACFFALVAFSLFATHVARTPAWDAFAAMLVP